MNSILSKRQYHPMQTFRGTQYQIYDPRAFLLECSVVFHAQETTSCPLDSHAIRRGTVQDRVTDRDAERGG